MNRNAIMPQKMIFFRLFFLLLVLPSQDFTDLPNRSLEYRQ